MVSHEQEFRAHLGGLASAERYVKFLRDISAVADRPITPQTLRSEADLDTFAAALASQYAEKSVENYRTVMRHYIDMVAERGL